MKFSQAISSGTPDQAIAAVAHAAKVLPDIISELQYILNAEAKYPQLKLGQFTKNRIQKLLKSAETIKYKKICFH